MDRIRLLRLEELLREEIARLISEGDIKDPRVGAFVSITRVEASSDGSHAKVWVSKFGDDETELEESVQGLQRAAGFIQSRIAKRVRIRLTPVLHFVADRGIRDGFEMTEKLKGLSR